MSEVVAETLPGDAARGAVRPDLRRRGGARPADGSDARRGRRGAGPAARGGARQPHASGPISSDDPVGAEIGGAVKNVLGHRLRHRGRAAAWARTRAPRSSPAASPRWCGWPQAKGGRAETLMGLSAGSATSPSPAPARSRATIRWAWRSARAQTLDGDSRRAAVGRRGSDVGAGLRRAGGASSASRCRSWPRSTPSSPAAAASTRPSSACWRGPFGTENGGSTPKS